MRGARMRAGAASVKAGQTIQELASKLPSGSRAGLAAAGATMLAGGDAQDALAAGLAGTIGGKLLLGRIGAPLVGKGLEAVGGALRKPYIGPFKQTQQALAEFSYNYRPVGTALKAAGLSAAQAGIFALGADSPEEAGQIMGGGAALGAAGAAASTLKSFGRDQLVRSALGGRESAGPAVPVKPLGFDKLADETNARALAQTTPAGAAFLSFARKLLPDQHVYFAMSDEDARSLHTRLSGVEQASGNWNGVSGTATDGKKFVIIRPGGTDAGITGEAGGHEVTHALKALGEADPQFKPLWDDVMAAADKALPENSAEYQELFSDYVSKLPVEEQARVTRDYILNEFVAEHGSVLLSGLPAGKLGGSKSVSSRLSRAFLKLAEKIGARGVGLNRDGSGPVTSEALPYTPSFNLIDALERAFDGSRIEASDTLPDASIENVAASTPPPVAPVPVAPAPTINVGTLNPVPASLVTPPAAPAAPAPNGVNVGVLNPVPEPLLTDRGQTGQTPPQQRVVAEEVAAAEPVLPATRPEAVASRNNIPAELDAVEKARVEFAQPNVTHRPTAEQVLSIAKAQTGSREAAPVVDVQYRDKESGELRSKRIAPYAYRFNSTNKDVSIIAVDLDRVYHSAKLIFDWAGEKGPARFGYSGPNDPAFTADLQTYLANHARSRKGGGGELQMGGEPSVAVREAAGTLPREKEQFFSMLMGVTPPENAVLARSVAAIARIRKTAQAGGVVPTELQSGSIEPNLLREALRKEGAPVERIGEDPDPKRQQSNPKDRNSFAANFSLSSFEGPVKVTGQRIDLVNTRAAEASFMPAATRVSPDVKNLLDIPAVDRLAYVRGLGITAEGILAKALGVTLTSDKLQSARKIVDAASKVQQRRASAEGLRGSAAVPTDRDGLLAFSRSNSPSPQTVDAVLDSLVRGDNALRQSVTERLGNAWLGELAKAFGGEAGGRLPTMSFVRRSLNTAAKTREVSTGALRPISSQVDAGVSREGNIASSNVFEGRNLTPADRLAATGVKRGDTQFMPAATKEDAKSQGAYLKSRAAEDGFRTLEEIPAEKFSEWSKDWRESQDAEDDVAMGRFMPAAKAETNADVQRVSKDYVSKVGIKHNPHDKTVSIDVPLSKRIADFYEAAVDSPNAPEVKKAYQALANETVEQWKAFEKEGYTAEPWTKQGQPYANSKEMLADVAQNKHLYYFKTEDGFGSGITDDMRTSNPMLAASGVSFGTENNVPVNDVFRVVHDIVGHGARGYEFGPKGEFNAYLEHSRMFSPDAKPALAAETLAQNSWVNYGPHLRKADGSLPAKGEQGFIPATERPFAPQKNIVIPNEILDAVEAHVTKASAFMPLATKETFSKANVKDLPTKGGWVVFTAENPKSTQASSQENARRNAALEADLKANGLEYFPVKGSYGRPENSFIVLDPNMSVEKAAELARKYDQDSVFTRHGLVYQDGSVNPLKGVNTFETRPDDFYTEHEGTFFSGDIDFDTRIQPDSIEGQTLRAEDAADSAALRFMPSAPDNLRRVVGVADEDGVSSKLGVALRHRDLGASRAETATRWRFDPATGELFWWGKPSEVIREDVVAHIRKKFKAAVTKETRMDGAPETLRRAEPGFTPAYMPAKALSSAKVKDNQTQFKTSPKKGSVGGVLELVHFSSKSLNEIDPNKSFGRGAATAADRQGMNKVFFYTKGTSYEHSIATRQNVYTAKVDGNAIYDYNSDPLEVRSITNREKRDQAMRDAGFAGFYVETDGFDAVALFEPTKVRSVEAEEVMNRRQLIDTGRAEMTPADERAFVKQDALIVKQEANAEKLRAKVEASVKKSPAYKAEYKRLVDSGKFIEGSFFFDEQMDNWVGEQVEKRIGKADTRFMPLAESADGTQRKAAPKEGTFKTAKIDAGAHEGVVRDVVPMNDERYTEIEKEVRKSAQFRRRISPLGPKPAKTDAAALKEYNKGFNAALEDSVKRQYKAEGGEMVAVDAPVVILGSSKTTLPKIVLQKNPELLFERLDKANSKIADDPMRLVDLKGYTELMQTAGIGSDNGVSIPPPSPMLKLMLENGQGYVDLVEGKYHGDRTVAGTVEAAMSGLDSTVKMRDAIGGRPPPLVTALHHLWGILSRMLPPIEQEAMWLRLVASPEVRSSIHASLEGKFNLSEAQWDQVVQDARLLNPTKRGNNATANANDFYLALTRLSGKWDAMSDAYGLQDSKASGRAFAKITSEVGNLGIRNKVQRFIGLTFGTPGLIMDRWKFVEFFHNLYGSTDGYFQYSKTGTPSDPKGIYQTYGKMDSGNPNFSLAFYEMMEGALQKAIDNSPEIRKMLGNHPNVGGLHWVGWNAIKNEAVGHSSLDLTYDLAKRSKTPDINDLAALLSEKEYFVEGAVGNATERYTLPKQK